MDGLSSMLQDYFDHRWSVKGKGNTLRNQGDITVKGERDTERGWGFMFLIFD